MYRLLPLLSALLLAHAALAAPPSDADRERFEPLLKAVSSKPEGGRTGAGGGESSAVAQQFSPRVRTVLWPRQAPRTPATPRDNFVDNPLTDFVARGIHTIDDFVLRDVRISTNGDLARIVGDATLVDWFMVDVSRPSDSPRFERKEVRLRIVKIGNAWKIDRIDAAPLDPDARSCEDRRHEPSSAYGHPLTFYIPNLSGRIVEVVYRTDDTLVILRERLGDWCLSMPTRDSLPAMGIPDDALQPYRELRVNVLLHWVDQRKALAVPAILGP
ncbi:MAG: hypothetical protein IPK81_20980 [Rhodospirillales bacterium]|nr:MAG: hypothetical protein IPK81_20980 [Rhodospirillales bacterium]